MTEQDLHFCRGQPNSLTANRKPPNCTRRLLARTAKYKFQNDVFLYKRRVPIWNDYVQSKNAPLTEFTIQYIVTISQQPLSYIWDSEAFPWPTYLHTFPSCPKSLIYTQKLFPSFLSLYLYWSVSRKICYFLTGVANLITTNPNCIEIKYIHCDLLMKTLCTPFDNLNKIFKCYLIG